MDIETKAVVKAIQDHTIEMRDMLGDISEKLESILSELSTIQKNQKDIEHVVSNKG